MALREVVEADGAVACTRQPVMRQRRLTEAPPPRKGPCVDTALARNEVRHMRIAEHRQPFRGQRDGLLDRRGQRRVVLAGQAVHQVEVIDPTPAARNRATALIIWSRGWTRPIAA
jgi:hypothetical protein